MKSVGNDPIGAAYKPWLIGSVILLVGSLFVLMAAMAVNFIEYSGRPLPIWLTLISVAAILGMLAGFAGLLGIMFTASWHSFREARRVQVLPPEK